MVGDDALKLIDIAIESDKSDLILLNEKAVILNNKKEYRASIAIYDNLISKQPEAYAYSNRGAIKSNLGQKQAEIIDYDRAIAINPNYAEFFYNRGIAKYDLGQKQAAIADLKNGAELFCQQNRMNDYQNISRLIQKIGS
jgi:tetratricopeptide (TPR) repeat protein